MHKSGPPTHTGMCVLKMYKVHKDFKEVCDESGQRALFVISLMKKSHFPKMKFALGRNFCVWERERRCSFLPAKEKVSHTFFPSPVCARNELINLNRFVCAPKMDVGHFTIFGGRGETFFSHPKRPENHKEIWGMSIHVDPLGQVSSCHWNSISRNVNTPSGGIRCVQFI